MRIRDIVPLLGLTLLLSGELALDTSAVAQSARDAAFQTGLILQQSEGERRVRRTRPASGVPLAASGMVIKVDQRNGGSPSFFMGYEEIAPGAAIPAHLHPDYDEIVIVHRGKALARLGSQEREVTPGATLYIPANARVSVKNTGDEPLSIFFIFPRPDKVSAYYRELTVAEGDKAQPFSAEDLTAFRARHRGHIVFDGQ
jgi:quercetin dioxygenase-like cupin family protein